MTLSVGEVERWDVEAVREVGHAARARGEALGSGAAELSGLTAVGSWSGVAASAAGEAFGRTCFELEALGREAFEIADRLGRAADRLEGLQAELRRVRVEASLCGCEVDASSGRIIASADARDGFAARRDAVPGLQARLDAVVEQADSVDSELSAVLRGAAESAPVVRPAPSQPRSGEWPTDHVNRRRLAEELERAQAAGSDDLSDLRALNRALLANPDIRLMLFDTSGARLRAAFAAGDPQTATHVSVTTPGMNTTVADSVDSMVAEAINLQRSATRQLALTPGRSGETVATIGWIGYDAPQIRTRDGLRGMVRGAYGVSHDEVAAAAAQDLSRFYAGIQAARTGDPAHLTAIGHSYGSLTTGLALQQPGEHGVTDAVFYGSPGVGAAAPRDLGLAPGHVYAMATPDDPIRFVYSAPAVGRVLAPVIPGPLDDVLLAAARVTGAGEFGPDPAGNPAFVQLETEAMWGLEGASGHSQYPRAGESGQRTSTYNLAAVVADLDANVITK